MTAQRYGYLFEDENYSDVASETAAAECIHCHETVITDREACWHDEHGNLVTDCMCSEYVS